MDRKEVLIGIGASILVACGPKIPLPSESPKPKEISGFLPGYIWRFNAGPHDDPDVAESEKIWYAVDIGIPEIVNPGQETKSGIKYPFGAVRAGKVHSLDSEAGLIHIKDEDGLIWRYEHLDLNPKLAVGQDVPLYGKLGIVSFRSAKGGHSTGLHVHLGILREINGELVKQPIDGLKIGEWTIHNGKTEKNGTMTNKKGEIIIADEGLCFPTKQNPVPCGRNEKGEIINNAIKTPIE